MKLTRKERESLHSASDRTLYSLVAESDRKIEGEPAKT
ncbi:MAG: hypothetical protein CM1200mP38_2360 [Dehalococcoidia bacterium]|nr:MAG: hypothetical protein CM1200mP38_2360 [Dehalococcoidia bacterium]